MAKYACIAVQKIRKKGIAVTLIFKLLNLTFFIIIEGSTETFGRYPNSHPIFEKLSEIVMDLSIPHSKWYYHFPFFLFFVYLYLYFYLFVLF